MQSTQAKMKVHKGIHDEKQKVNITQPKQATTASGNTRLLRISESESQAIANCFRLYDYKSTGYISKSSAKKLINSLGFDVPTVKMSSDVSLQELLLFLDQWAPEPEPALECSLAIWLELVSKGKLIRLTDGTETKCISSQDIADFMKSIGKPSISITEANCLLTSMLDYDDCTEDPRIPVDVFAKNILLFSRKNNISKDYAT